MGYLIQKIIKIGDSTIPNVRYGVFAGEPVIAEGSIICECPLLQIQTYIPDYHFSFEGNIYIALGFGSLFNHSDNPNSVYKYENKLLKVIAIKNIYKDEEIFFDYGQSYNRKYLNFNS